MTSAGEESRAHGGRRGSVTGLPVRSLRWIILVVFLAALFPGITPLTTHDPAFAWLTLAAAAACLLLLACLWRPARQSLWAWLLLAVFVIGCYVQTLFVSRYLGVGGSVMDDLNPEWGWVTYDHLAQGYAKITVAFVVFCLAAAACLTLLPWRPERPADPDRAPSPRRLGNLLAILTFLVVGLAALRAGLGIGVMGIEADILPYRLGTLIFRSQSHLVPALILLGAWARDAPRQRPGSVPFLVLLLGHSLLVGVISASKAGVVKFALPVFFLWVCGRRLTRRRLLAVVACLCTLFAMYPLMAHLRVAAISASAAGGGVDLGEVATDAMSRDFLKTTAIVSRQLLLRLIGASGVWYAVRESHSQDAASWHPEDDTFVVYYTRDVAGVDTPGDFRAPGLTAAFMLLGGETGVIVLWTGFTIAVALLWLILSRLHTWPVAQAQAAFQLLQFASEGTLQMADLLACGISILACEVVFRRWLLQRRPAAGTPHSSAKPA